MNKAWVVGFGVVLITLVALMTGCGGGVGDDSVGSGASAQTNRVLLSAIASGPAGMAPLAALKARTIPAILPEDIRTELYRAYIRTSTGMIEVTPLYLSADRYLLKFDFLVDYASEFIVEIYQKNTALSANWQENQVKALFRGVITVPAPTGSGQIIAQSITLGALETARALAYEVWKNQVAPTGTYVQFLSGASSNDLASLSVNLETQQRGWTTAALSSGTITLPAAIVSQASGIGTAVPAPVNPSDTTPPAVVAISPAAGAANVAANTLVAITFSEGVAPGTISSTTIMVKDSLNATIQGSFSTNGVTVTFTPAQALSSGQTYTVTVANVKDLSDNLLNPGFSSSFQIRNDISGDVTPPVVGSISPRDGATLIATTTHITITFNEPIDVSSLTSSLVSFSEGLSPVSGTLTSPIATSLVFSPIALSGGRTYSVRVSGVKDLAGNSMSVAYTSSFSTLQGGGGDSTPPRIISTIPANQRTNVATNTSLSLTLSEPVLETTISTSTVALYENNRLSTYSVAYSGTLITITPAQPLKTGTPYALVVTSTVRDLAGNAMIPPFRSTFTTVTDLPNGFNTSAFPAVGTQITVSPLLSAQKSTLIVVNASATQRSYTIGSTFSGATPSRYSGSLASVHQSAPAEPNGEQQFQNHLRRLERNLPRLFLGGSSSALMNRSMLRDTIGQSRSFQVAQDAGPAISVPAQCLEQRNSGSGVTNFYVDNDLDSASSTVQDFVTQLAIDWPDSYATVRENIGTEPPLGNFNGITLNDDITILILRTDKIDPDDYGIAGFFYGVDLYPQATYSESNERKIFYIHYLPNYLTFLKGTLAHEFQHMVNFYQRKILGLSEDDWLNEALSGYAEHLCGYGIVENNRSKALQANDFFSEVEANGLTTWTGNDADYGQVYLFGTWLAQKFGNSGDIRPLLQSSSVGTAAVTSFTGTPFPQILGEWHSALFINDYSTPGRYGIENLDLQGVYQGIQLSGPHRRSRTFFPGSDGLTIAAGTAAYLQLSPDTEGVLTLNLPSDTIAYEVHK